MILSVQTRQLGIHDFLKRRDPSMSQLTKNTVFPVQHPAVENTVLSDIFFRSKGTISAERVLGFVHHPPGLVKTDFSYTNIFEHFK